MKIEFTGHKVSLKIRRIVKKSFVKALEYLKQDHSKIEVGVAFLSFDEIQSLNRETRNIDKATDVLSYPSFNIKPYDILNVDDNMLYRNRLHLGDMALCLPQAKVQAEEYGVSLESEVQKLSVHSALHLMGFDHIEDSDYEVMNKAEQEIEKLLK